NHALAGVDAHGCGDDDQAIGELLGALGVLEGEQEPTEDLASVLANCASFLAHTQLFSLAVETGERAVTVAASAGLPAGRFRYQAGEAALTWAIRLEHLQMADEAIQQWRAATDHYVAALESLDDLGPLFAAGLYAHLALAQARIGEPRDARRSLEAADRLPRQALLEVRRVLEHVTGAVLLAEARYA